MKNEKITRWEILAIRKILRLMDLYHINNKKMYIDYYQFILKRLNPILEKTWYECSHLNNNLGQYSNNNVWVMWWQGIESAPKIIQTNIKNLKRIFGSQLIIISKNNFKNYTDINEMIIHNFNYKNISFTQWSDIVRYNLLKNNGGLWIDSSVLVSNKFMDLPYFFNADYYSLCSLPNTYRFISLGRWTGWFVGGKSNYGLFNFMDKFFINYYSKYDKTIDYFFADDAVNYYYSHSIEFQKEVKKQSKEWDPYLFIRNFKTTNANELIYKFQNDPKYSVQKLTYKFNFDKAKNNSLAKKVEFGFLDL